MRGVRWVKSDASGFDSELQADFRTSTQQFPPVSAFIEGKAFVRGIIGLVGPAGYSSRAHTHTHTGGREREGRELPVPVNFTHIQPGDKLSRYHELKTTFHQVDKTCSVELEKKRRKKSHVHVRTAATEQRLRASFRLRRAVRLCRASEWSGLLSVLKALSPI